MSDADRETRSLFFRVLATCYWAQSAQMYSDAEQTLEKVQLHLNAFVESANHLYHISRVQMPSCTIPLPCVLPAADVLTSGTYNRLPSCYFDFTQKDRHVPAKITRSRIHKGLIIALATKDLTQFKFIRFKTDHLILSTSHVDIFLSTLNNENGPWKVFDMKLKITNAMEKNREVVTKAQVQSFCAFIDFKISSMQDPFNLLYKITRRFSLKLIFEIIRIQLSNYLRMTEFKSESTKDGVLIKFWDGPHSFNQFTVSFKIDDVILVKNDPPLPMYDIDISDSTDVDCLKLIKSILELRTSDFILKIYNGVIDKCHNFGHLFTFYEGGLAFKPTPAATVSYHIYFWIDNLGGRLLTEGSRAEYFTTVSGLRLTSNSSIDDWVEFLCQYRRYSTLNVLGSFINEFSFQWCRIIKAPNIASNNCVKTLESIEHDFGNLYLLFISALTSISLTMIGTSTMDNDLISYRIFLISPFGQKSFKQCSRDVHIKKILNTSEMFSLKFANEIPVFALDGTKNLGLVNLIRALTEKTQLQALVMGLKLIGSGCDSTSLSSQNVFRYLSLTPLFIDRLTPPSFKPAMGKFLTDASLRHDYYQQKWYVEFHFSSYLSTIFPRVFCPHIKLINLTTFDFNPFGSVIDSWKSFLTLFDLTLKIISNSSFSESIVFIELRFDSLTIVYDKVNKFKISIFVNSGTVGHCFYSYKCNNPFSDEISSNFMARYFKNKSQIYKILFYVFKVSKPVAKLKQMQKLVELNNDLDVSKLCPYIFYNQVSLSTFCINYRNCYSINLTFLSGTRVQITDNSYSNLWRDKNLVKNAMIPMYYLGKFLAFESQMLNKKCLKYPPHTYEIDIETFDNLIASSCLIYNKNGSAKKYSKLLIFFESCFLLRNIACIFKISQYFAIDNNEISFSVGNFALLLGHCVGVRNTPLYVSISIYLNEKSISRNAVCVILEQYLYTKILSDIFNPASLIQFFSLLNLDNHFIVDFVMILRIELNPREDLGWVVEWRHVPSSSIPFRHYPINKFCINQGSKYIIMIDYIYQSDPSLSITQLFLWSVEFKNVQDFLFFPCSKLSSRSEEINQVLEGIKDMIREIVTKKNIETLPIHQIVQISLKCLIENEFIVPLI